MYDTMNDDYDPYPESQAFSDNEANDYAHEGEDEYPVEDECSHERTRMDDGISTCLDCGDRIDTDADED